MWESFLALGVQDFRWKELLRGAGSNSFAWLQAGGASPLEAEVKSASSQLADDWGFG